MLRKVGNTAGGVVTCQATNRQQRRDTSPQVRPERISWQLSPEPFHLSYLAKALGFLLPVFIRASDPPDRDLAKLCVQRHHYQITRTNLLFEAPQLPRPVTDNLVGGLRISCPKGLTDTLACITAAEVAKLVPAHNNQALTECHFLALSLLPATHQPGCRPSFMPVAVAHHRPPHMSFLPAGRHRPALSSPRSSAPNPEPALRKSGALHARSGARTPAMSTKRSWTDRPGIASSSSAVRSAACAEDQSSSVNGSSTVAQTGQPGGKGRGRLSP